ncbi:MAG: ATP-dependent RNA helicase HrpA [Pseudomonadales bacterium]|nr:ATP-dependent RNA helicase HrpA [Pseudomonadales bacterium]MCP5215067.1 ATP-dependent RNA helicase HrpA [Pseudomonadales bacterium]
MNNLEQKINQQIAESLLLDRHRFRTKLARLLADRNKLRFAELIAVLKAQIDSSCEKTRQRRAALPLVSFPEELPISQKRQEIADAIKKHQVVVIAGETGSGKTTQLPKVCLALGRGVYGMIGHTQPRRLAARTVANRIAEELKVTVGQQVGYQVRFTDQVSEQSHIKLMTDGILLAETQNDPYLNRYDTLIIDEAHERSLNIDFLLGYIKRILPKRPDLKVIITSATIDLERFSKHFNNAPIIEVSGRTYPVELIYQPPAEQENSGDEDLNSAIIQAVETIRSLPRRPAANDVLIFLPGEREIRDIAHALKSQNYRHTDILPLYARLSNSEQNRVFQPHSGQRIVLATNVAETSITVPGIGYVIDPGYARISRYSARSKVQRLPIEPVSQASANQRMGRCGRIADGLCIRLYSEEDFNNRPEFTDAEILRTNLASVILQMLNLRLGEIEQFPFIDPPDSRAIRDGFELLRELGAVNDQQRITAVGKQIARFPVDPRIGRMVLAAAKRGSLKEVSVIAAALTIQEPRERPLDKQQAADEKHRAYQDENSDFIAFVNLWDSIESQRQALSENQFKKYCRTQFLSYLRIREWRDVHRQLVLVCRDMGLKQNQQAADYAAIHKALLSGLLSHIGEKQENKEYKGARNRTFYLFPGSGLFKRSPKWVMAAELVETTKLYARAIAKIEPEWIEPEARHLIKKSHSEPHWEKKRAQVIAYEQVSLYGLIIVARRSVDFGQIEAKLAREIFIMSALVEGQLQTRAYFYRQNQKLLEEVATLEDKSRRRDILVDEQTIFDFYNERLPENICSGRQLESWIKKADKQAQDSLLITREYLMQHSAAEINEEQFPNSFVWQNLRLALTYCFQPGSAEDGVSLNVPLGLINQLPGNRLEWLVPGMLRDKCIALVKALPKALRKNFVPVPDYVDRALREMEVDDKPLTQALAYALKRVSGVDIPAQSWDIGRLEDFYKMRICIVDEAGVEIGQGRDLQQLRNQFKRQVKESLQSLNRSAYERKGITEWDFGRINQEVEIRQAGMAIKAYSALRDEGDSVSLQLIDTREKAENISRQAVLRLLILNTAQEVKYLKKNLPGLKQIALCYATLGSYEQLMDDLIRAIYQRVFLAADKLPQTAECFSRLITENKRELISVGTEIAVLIEKILIHYQQLAKIINGKVPPPWLFVYSDIKAQLQHLVFDGFIASVPWCRLTQYPRYLQAITMRLDKIQNQLDKEKSWCAEFIQLWQGYDELKQKASESGVISGKVEDFRWMLEEYRVSLYAQKLGTNEPVSRKRLEKYMACL